MQQKKSIKTIKHSLIWRTFKINTHLWDETLNVEKVWDLLQFEFLFKSSLRARKHEKYIQFIKKKTQNYNMKKFTAMEVTKKN